MPTATKTAVQAGMTLAGVLMNSVEIATAKTAFTISSRKKTTIMNRLRAPVAHHLAGQRPHGQRLVADAGPDGAEVVARRRRTSCR